MDKYVGIGSMEAKPCYFVQGRQRFVPSIAGVNILPKNP